MDEPVGSEEIPTVQDFDDSKERLRQMGCTCDNMITGWEDGGHTWYWFSQHEDDCPLWLIAPSEND